LIFSFRDCFGLSIYDLILKKIICNKPFELPDIPLQSLGISFKPFVIPYFVFLVINFDDPFVYLTFTLQNLVYVLKVFVL